MKNLLLAFTFLVAGNYLNAQSFTLYGDKTFGGDNTEEQVLITLIDTNKILITGRSKTDMYWDKTDPLCSSNDYDMWALMVDTAFSILWQKSIGGIRKENNDNVFIQANSPYLYVTSSSTSDTSCEKTENRRGTAQADYWVIKIDTNGSVLWDKTIGGNSSELYASMIQLGGGDFLIAGQSNSVVGWDKTVANYGSFDIWVVKFDSIGNKLWDKVFGGTSGEGRPQVKAVADGGFVLCVNTSSPVSGTITHPPIGITNLNDFYFTKIDSSGTVLWDKRYGGTGNDVPTTFICTDDNGFLLGGYTDSPVSGDITEPTRGSTDIWLIKTDSIGNKQWEKRYGGNKGDLIDKLAKAPGGGYWFSGSTDSDSSYEVSENTYGLTDYWIVKIDSIGNKVWDKRFGGNSGDIETSFIIMPDSSIFLAGSSYDGQSAVKTDTSKGLSDYWIVHFKYSDMGTGIVEHSDSSEIKVWPNPATNQINIKCRSTPENITVTMYDMTGKIVYVKEKILLNSQVNISQLTKGVYYLNTVGDKINKTVKMIKI